MSIFYYSFAGVEMAVEDEEELSSEEVKSEHIIGQVKIFRENYLIYISLLNLLNVYITHIFGRYYIYIIYHIRYISDMIYSKP